MTSHGSEHDPSVQTMLETERHRRIVAEERAKMAGDNERDAMDALDRAVGCITGAVAYLDSLTADTPLKANVLRILHGEEEEKCQRCGGTRSNPRTLTDDSYSAFPCPWPFHDGK